MLDLLYSFVCPRAYEIANALGIVDSWNMPLALLLFLYDHKFKFCPFATVRRFYLFIKFTLLIFRHVPRSFATSYHLRALFLEHFRDNSSFRAVPLWIAFFSLYPASENGHQQKEWNRFTYFLKNRQKACKRVGSTAHNSDTGRGVIGVIDVLMYNGKNVLVLNNKQGFQDCEKYAELEEWLSQKLDEYWDENYDALDLVCSSLNAFVV
ncbi:hypothetical protein GIB67_036405 [Kingdonia uniflora]|uniref:Morc S5 domain-containing protein n=1 Tax=Kingdonia uniflora TaxID=39325 RepID=A0A7J7L488_9MAGN|nr:hypothetical protein GIB67_036405 [Kingdonia uniflora]